ncbi:hypothetical protein FK535_09150 [Mycolicibacterium sp. 018/SC-01/001]|uniref:hypothetical protein n=1 Tax=Mycolicibacterium sp. 018/SC-01/001 TaxID=2592069 RepID=UPI001180638F|nr:hypothetical protein [Mycolicibacterium sp. 018/SC-01/001]TRW85552.1 hypothetical protein FK535_09150 [Mycolicibacterium sp. 018/SC-01/001]
MNTDAYEAYIAQAKLEMEKDPALSGEQVEAAVSAMQKTKLLFTGSPVGTILRNVDTGEVATRVVDAGIPLWRVNQPDGGTYNTHDPVMQPEDKWGCVWSPQS